MENTRLDNEIFKRDEEAIRKINELAKKANLKEEKLEGKYFNGTDAGKVTVLSKKEEKGLSKEDAVTRDFDKKRDKILKDTAEKDREDAIRADSYVERQNAHVTSEIERRDEDESKHSLHQVEYLNEKEKFEEKIVSMFDDHDLRKIDKLASKENITDEDKKEIAKLKQKIADRDQKLKEREQADENKLDAKQAEEVEKVLEKDAKDAEKYTN